jgi:glycosyltransferase involved in cell wall biosynthesis
MRFTVITPNYNGAAFLEQAIRSVVSQREQGLDLEYIVVDGKSTDGSLDIIQRFEKHIGRVIVEEDTGPANAINKGFAASTGEVVSWLNADDLYMPGALGRIQVAMKRNPDASFCFGRCPIIDEDGREIRKPITRFKEAFFPVSSPFTLQCVNYVSQPAVFFRRSALEHAGFLREDWIAAWDYDLWLRLLKQGRAVRIEGSPLAAFRWHEASIGGNRFSVQFKEELDAVISDAGPLAPQTLIHHGVRWGIVGIYSMMAWRRKSAGRSVQGAGN